MNNNNYNSNSNEEEGLNKMKLLLPKEVTGKDIQEGEVSKTSGAPEKQAEELELSSPPSI